MSKGSFAVIGWPLGYSLSPMLHTAFLQKEGIEVRGSVY